MKRPLRLVLAPSNLGLKALGPGPEPGVRFGPDVLMDLGLGERLGASAPIRVDAPPYVSGRGETGILNDQAIANYSRLLADVIHEGVETNQFQLVIGGDCSILLGVGLGLSGQGRYGLAFFDGHRDMLGPDQSVTGGAAGMDLALATGRGPSLLAGLSGATPLFDDAGAVAIGCRERPHDPEEITLEGSDIRLFDLERIREMGASAVAEEALAGPLAKGDGFWIHVDVDVLDSQIMPAVDSPQDDGLSYEELGALLRPMVHSDRAVGMHVTIYDPARDPNRQAGEGLVGFLVDLLNGQ